MLFPCRAANGLDCVLPIWLKQCGRVWFTHVIPGPCRATTMPFWKRLLKATAQCGMGAAWEWHGKALRMWITIGRTETARGRLARVRLLPATTRSSTKVCYQKHTVSLNCRTNSSDISDYHAEFQEHFTVGDWQGRGMACVNYRDPAWQGNSMGTAMARHGTCELALKLMR
jgi:hypothetical protein